MSFSSIDSTNVVICFRLSGTVVLNLELTSDSRSLLASARLTILCAVCRLVRMHPIHKGNLQSAQNASTLLRSVGWAVHNHISNKRDADDESWDWGRVKSDILSVRLWSPTTSPLPWFYANSAPSFSIDVLQTSFSWGLPSLNWLQSCVNLCIVIEESSYFCLGPF